VNLVVDTFCFQRLITVILSAFQTYFMFKLRLKVGCSLIYLSAQLRKSYFIFKDVLRLNNKS